MDYTYQATGGIQMIGCSSYKLIHFRHYKYRIGSILFSKEKAMRGIYEKIAVKSVRFPNPYVNLYVDTFNALWNEDEIVSYETAVGLVKEYANLVHDKSLDAIKNCK
jgi:hypothetical protein